MYNKLGTYTTMDAPLKNIEEAFQFLKIRFEKIEGRAWEKMNAYDNDDYLSFEIDYPLGLEDLDEDDEDDENIELLNKKDKFEELAGKIEDAYSNKFFND